MAPSWLRLYVWFETQPTFLWTHFKSQSCLADRGKPNIVMGINCSAMLNGLKSVLTLKASGERRKLEDMKTGTSTEREEMKADFCVIESVEHKSPWGLVYVGAVLHPHTQSAIYKTRLYEFTPICTIWTDQPLFWRGARSGLWTIWVNASDLLICTDTQYQMQ